MEDAALGLSLAADKLLADGLRGLETVVLADPAVWSVAHLARCAARALRLPPPLLPLLPALPLLGPAYAHRAATHCFFTGLKASSLLGFAPQASETGLHLAHSKSLDGPWTVVLGITKAGGTNPGVLILKSGKVILFYKGSATFPFNSTLCPAGRCRSIGLVTAPAWDSFPYSDFLTTVRKNSTLNTAFRRQFHLKTSI